MDHLQLQILPSSSQFGSPSRVYRQTQHLFTGSFPFIILLLFLENIYPIIQY